MAHAWKLPETDRHIIDAFKKAGPRSAVTRNSINDVVFALPTSAITAPEIANALLFMLFAQPSQHYSIDDFVSAIDERSKQGDVNWNSVVRHFDVPDIRVNADTFTRLVKALVPISHKHPNFDIQSLWAGRWSNPRTQVSFLRSLFEQQSIKPAQIPGFQTAFQAAQFEDASPQMKERVRVELDKPTSNLPALRAVWEVALTETIVEDDDAQAILHGIVRDHLCPFLLSLSQITHNAESFTTVQDDFMMNLYRMLMEGGDANNDVALECLFHQDRNMVWHLCTMIFHIDPRMTAVITRKARQMGWIEYMLERFNTPLALDIACALQKAQADFDMDQWLTQITENLPHESRLPFGNTLVKFLRIKADDEYRHQKDEIPYQSEPLNLASASALLWKIQEIVGDRETLRNAQTTCFTTYPRLLNYGSEANEILERLSEARGHNLPKSADLRMSELFGQMYRSEVTIRDMVAEMRGYKTSQDPDQQDLFCCIVHGLFDEYGCYGEYPEEALEKTALLFGSIIKFRLLPPIPQEYGLTLVGIAVRDSVPDSKMHRFGIEAIMQLGDQISEYPELCATIAAIPSLRGTELYDKAEEGLQGSQLRGGMLQRNGHVDGLVNGSSGESRLNGISHSFRSVQADPVPSSADFSDPDELSQDKILFVINNLSMENMNSKLGDLRKVLKPEHAHWFAAYLVEQRVKTELNNQELYKNCLIELSDEILSAEVLRQTYGAIIKVISAKSTMESAVERGHLKNLAGWLGLLTLAQDKPIKHRNIYFVDLLQEGFETQRLLVVIPFTCKVLVQGKDSLVFKPPNPWLMEILGVLIELYHFAELKLTLRFEIEVLFTELSLDYKKFEPSTLIREFQSSQQIEELTNASAIDDINDYDLTLRGGRLRESFGLADIMHSLPSLDSVLRYPPPSGNQQAQEAVKQIINKAVQRAVEEIILPVVERSITIASLSSSQLVTKDYAVESSPDKFSTAAREMVKSLAGSLALVTCKEPLRMSIQNYIRQYVDEIGGTFMAEGQIMMTVNDNLDVAAQLIKEAAEKFAIPEMDAVVEAEIADRRRFLAENPGGQYYSQPLINYSRVIPEPYRIDPRGLNDTQRAVYEAFETRVHGAGHFQNVSIDSTGHRLPDVLNEPLAMPNLSTPSGQPAMPHHSPLTQQNMNSLVPHNRVNGVTDSLPPHERLGLLVEEIQSATRASSESRLRDIPKDSIIAQHMNAVFSLLSTGSLMVADLVAKQAFSSLIRQPPQNNLEAEVMVRLLKLSCSITEPIAREVLKWITQNEDALFTNAFTVTALVRAGFVDFSRVDGLVAISIREEVGTGLHLLAGLMDQMLFNEEPIALRADLIQSIFAVYSVLKEQPGHALALEISNKLKANGVPQFVESALNDEAKAKQDQMAYVFREWCALYENTTYTEPMYAGFLRDLNNNQLINSPDDMVTFLRLSIDACVSAYEVEAQSFRGSFAAAFSRTDALALLIMLLVKFQGEANGAVKISKPNYLDSMLSLIVLIVNSHQELRGVDFNQRVFTRLFTSLLYNYAEFKFDDSQEHAEYMLTFAKILMSLQPTMMPAFAFGWISLICHRVFIDGMLAHGDETCVDQYRELVGMMLQYSAAVSEVPTLQRQAEALVQGVWKNMFVIQHDYSDFVCANHAYFASRTSLKETTIRNLIISAKPFGLMEPNPLTNGLRLDRITDMTKAPIVGSEITEPLDSASLLQPLQAAFRKTSDIEIFVGRVTEALSEDAKNEPSFAHPAFDVEILCNMMVYIAQEASSAPPTETPYTQLIDSLFAAFQPRHKYLLVTAIFDQIRYPNSHTLYALKLVLHLWGKDTHPSPERAYIREMIIRLLRERLDPVRPNPWGAIICFKELSDSDNYGFWDAQPFVAEPELRQRLVHAARSGGQ